MAKRNGDKIIKGPSTTYVPEEGGLGKILFYKMKSNGDCLAQIHSETGEYDSNNSLLERSVRTAIKMQMEGLSKGDIITICSTNHLNSYVPQLAAYFLGVVPANLDPSIPLADTAYLLKQVKPKMIFVSENAVKLIEDALEMEALNSKIVVFGNSTDHLEFSEFLKTRSTEKDFKPLEVGNKETAVIIFSSGTTGLPKGICLNHHGLLVNCFAFRDVGFDVSNLLGHASLYWISTISFLTASILLNTCRIVAPKYNPHCIWNLVEQLRVTIMFLAPVEAFQLCKHKKPDENQIASLKQIIIGGGYIPIPQMEQLRDLLPRTKIMMAYGLTESMGATITFHPRRPEDMVLAYKKPTSTGKALPGFSFKIVDLDTKEILGPNQQGELFMKCDIPMNGYFNVDSSDAWDSDGWLRTGDIAHYDDDRCFYIVGRVKEMFKYRSWHVLPTLIERVLMTHPAIETAVVFGVPHPEDGEHPLAVVVLKPSYHGVVSEREIEEFVDDKVNDRMKLRGGVKIIDAIPTTPTGKINKREVKQMVINKKI